MGVDAREPTSENASPQDALLDEESARAARRLSRRRALTGMLVVVVLAALVRLPLIKFPMEQSAGTAAYVGQRWLDGAIPYRDTWDYQGPGLYLMSGIVVRAICPLGAAFEQGVLRLFLGSEGKALRVTMGEAAPETCRLVMLLIDLGTVLLVYVFVRRWCNRTEAVAAAGICGFFGGAILVQGECLGPGQPMTFLVVLSMLAALRSAGKGWSWLALGGLAGGMAMCLRPVALLYVVALMVWVIATNGGSRSRLTQWVLRPGVILLCALVPLGCFVIYFWWQGALEAFWRNAVVYNAMYRWLPGPRRLWSQSLRAVGRLVPEQGALWLFAGGWTLHAFSVGFRRETGLVALWGIVAVAAAMTARRVEEAHFLQTVPPLAIGAALAATNPSEPFLRRDERGRLETRSTMLILFTVALALGFLYTERAAYLRRARREDISTDWAAVQVAHLIRTRTMPHHPIYVWGTRPQIYVLADRPAAHRFFYNRPLNVARQVREFFGAEVFDDIYKTLMRVQPAYVVTTEQYVREDIDSLGPIAPWFYFMREHYELWKIVDAQPYSFTIFARRDRALLP